jgi:hypothetical protein
LGLAVNAEQTPEQWDESNPLPPEMAGVYEKADFAADFVDPAKLRLLI